MIAVRPKAGMSKAMQTKLGGLPLKSPRRQTLGGFDVIELEGSAAQVHDHLQQIRHDPTVAVGSHVFHTSGDEIPFVPTGTMYIEFDPAASDEEKQSILDGQKLELLEARDDCAYLCKTTSASHNPLKVAAALQQQARVLVAEPELATMGKVKSMALPTDSLLREQWHLRNTGRHRGTSVGFKKGADARVIDAWRATESLGSPQLTVAVIDDGFDLSHPDLAEPGSVVAPWDFTRNTSDPSPDHEAGDWHGTACAGVAVGRVGGGQIVGAAPAVKLMPVRWGPNLADTQVEAWFEYVMSRGADVVSCSWGAAAAFFPLSTRVKKAITRCATKGRGGKGCVIVFAAGNSDHDINAPEEGSLDGFAIHPHVIAVAASTSRDQRSHYSNYGKEIAVCAPSSGAGGAGILTSDVTGYYQQDGKLVAAGYAPDGYTYDFGGTSSACPLVAGICALILSVNPNLTSMEVKAILQRSARRIGEGYDQKGHSKWFGYGCVNAEEAVRIARGAKREELPLHPHEVA